MSIVWYFLWLCKKCGSYKICLFLTKKIPELSRTKIQKYIKDGSIRVGEEKIKPNWILSEGEELIGNIERESISIIEPENLPLEVLFEDNHYIAINKRSGMIVHPGNGINNGTHQITPLSS